MNIEETKKEAEAQKAGGEEKAEKTVADVPKKDKANVELFVMSHCPFGTQIEKGILPVIEALGDKMDFTLKFCDYAMHSEKELKEQMTQYCIQKEEPKKLVSYLRCFLGTKEGSATESEACLKTTGINAAKIKTCVADTDTKYKVSANFKDKSTYKGSYASFDVYKEDNAKYGVGGSPTLVINGEKISSGRDAKTLMSTICAGFEKEPDACKKEMSSASPSAGFGFNEASGEASAATCE
jgi:glutaredoxin